MNRRILLESRPVGAITDDCFRIESVQVPEPADGEALIRNLYVSIDPATRGWMNGADTYLPAIEIGEVIRAGGVGVVESSRSVAYSVGDIVYGMVGWQDYCVAGPGSMMTKIPRRIRPTDALGVYGITGVTAYFGVLDLGQPVHGETVLVSGAAGATGSIAGQIARLQGCRVVGIAGTDEKCRWVTEHLRFDACINYRIEDFAARLRETCPDGVDVFFDSVGGWILDEVLAWINMRARIVLCGAISMYNETEPLPGPRNYVNLILRRARMEGFVVLDYLDRFRDAVIQLSAWVADGSIRHEVSIVDGLERAPDALRSLFAGENTGKLLLKISDEPQGLRAV